MNGATTSAPLEETVGRQRVQWRSSSPALLTDRPALGQHHRTQMPPTLFSAPCTTLCHFKALEEYLEENSREMTEFYSSIFLNIIEAVCFFYLQILEVKEGYLSSRSHPISSTVQNQKVSPRTRRWSLISNIKTIKSSKASGPKASPLLPHCTPASKPLRVVIFSLLLPNIFPLGGIHILL